MIRGMPRYKLRVMGIRRQTPRSCLVHAWTPAKRLAYHWPIISAIAAGNKLMTGTSAETENYKARLQSPRSGTYSRV